ncbi:MAG: hypothetical protein ACD_72C00297G0001 [uncultured bacterium]|nr:MAG: hypothetical protein ACD_72C00297G0001 [uncultured bacterium]
MANYKYRCSDCGNVFGIEATIREKEECASEKFICPQCHSMNVRSEFSAKNFIKNIFNIDNKAGCCSGDNSSDASCKPNKKDSHGSGNSNGCCG